MPSPFPGMDPYLEDPKLWPEFQQQMLGQIAHIMRPGLDDRYRLRTGMRHYVNEQVLLVSVIREEHNEVFLEVCQRSTRRVVALVDMPSPTNRTTESGRKAYVDIRDTARRNGAHLVEIDLVRQGQTCLDITTEGLPPWDYAVSVGRIHQPDRYELYTSTIRKRLPRFRLPLAGDDRDLVLDLQKIFDRCYDRHFVGRIDYQAEPPVPLDEDNNRWTDQLLREHGWR